VNQPLPTGAAIPTAVANTPPKLQLQPPSFLLQGPSGCGKTHSIATLCKAGIETFVIITEPGGVESLLDGLKFYGAPIDKLHWMTVLPATEGFDALDEMTKHIGNLDFEGVSKLKGVGKNKTRQPAEKFVNALKDFRDERTFTSFGSFTAWDHSRALVVDSLSGLSTIAWYLTVGYKPTGAPGEWNIAMNFIEALLMKINSDRRCFFVLTAHIERETDEIAGVQKIMTSTLGRKLAPKIPRFFSEVVYAQRLTTDPKFRWSTLDAQAELKNRSLPVRNSIVPDFGPVVEAFRNRLKMAGG
jgi:hypothetical protein